ncbi:MAG: LCP family protein [Chloroflexi bacterium]|nr:LCP family protein [Chloroflexota bacterium]
MTEEDPGPGPASPGRAAFLSFVLPGLGQIALGEVRSGLLLAVPILATLTVAAFFILADRADLVSWLFDPPVILALVVLDVALGLNRVVAIGDAWWLARQRAVASGWGRPRGSGRLVAGLLAATVLLHGGIGVVGVQAYGDLTAVFEEPGTGFVIPLASFGTPQPTRSPEPGATEFSVSPLPGPAWAADGRLNVILIGGDAGPGRWSLRTDTMILLSADVATGRVALFGIPRNLYGAPLPPESAGATPDGTFPGLLNALWVYADQHPSQFPGDDQTRGFRAITGALQQLTGVPIDGAVVVNLNGFVDLVDAIGGVWVNVPYHIHDDTYPLENGTGDVVLDIRSGCQHLDGHFTLALARSRHQDSDYGRMTRQQLVLEALARQLDPISLIMQVPHLLQIAGTNIRTTFQPQDMGLLLRFAATVDRTNVTNVEFFPPTYPEVLTKASIAKIQNVVRTIFGSPSASPGPSGSSGSPAPTPRPTKGCPA